jgi:hypothetical protein
MDSRQWIPVGAFVMRWGNLKRVQLMTRSATDFHDLVRHDRVAVANPATPTSFLNP